jgi:RNA polymerase sigma-70 factor, ECF subfamily
VTPAPAPDSSAAEVVAPRAPSPAADECSLTRSDGESRRWLRRLGSQTGERETAIDELHALLLAAASSEVRRRARMLPHLRGEPLDDIAAQAADDALVAVLGKLSEFRGASRFTTWAYKFALLEAAVGMRRRAWQSREVVLADDTWSLLAHTRPSPSADAETAELLGAIAASMNDDLTAHQREVVIALAVDGVPLDVLAERLNTTRGALYKTLHDARRRLRRRLTAAGLLTATDA